MLASSKALDKVNKIIRARRWKSKEVFDIFYNKAKGLECVNLILGVDSPSKTACLHWYQLEVQSLYTNAMKFTQDCMR